MDRGFWGSKKNKLRLYYLSWLRNKILHNDPEPYHKFMAFKSFGSLPQKPLSIDLTVEEGQRLKVIYGSLSGFHAIDVDSGTPYDLYLPTHCVTAG
ncbi:hypothetical protein CRUP_024938 [Coryphaenoides rupestris]|nr:hypothetical protein CRUP_024938 [Coryphaenoides rupestris]